ncbi:metallophosphoesterase [Paenibacillus sp. FSL M8-0334]|uniref:metallophosphoesterase n=1 Tax=Paenibacillus sp. FSL M8-0334 TaxID=2921623 RepID=UPI0030FB8C53
MGRLLAVSDVHGYGNLLEALLEHVKYDPAADRLFLLGDYVNKGPDSGGTLELVAALCASGAVALQGNNERKWLLRMPEHAVTDVSRAEKYLKWIDSMPLWAQDGEYVFVHAGLRPGIPLSCQTPEDLTTIREPFFHAPAIGGHTIVFGHTSTWRLGADYGQLWRGEGKLGIDTGAGHGHYLSLVDLTSGWQYAIHVSAEKDILRRRIS